MAHLSACVPLSASLSVSLSPCVQVFPALAQVQALRRVNECLLAENRAMLRVLARLSETASMPETEDLWSFRSSALISSLLYFSSTTNLHHSFFLLLLLQHLPFSSAVGLSGRSRLLNDHLPHTAVHPSVAYSPHFHHPQFFFHRTLKKTNIQSAFNLTWLNISFYSYRETAAGLNIIKYLQPFKEFTDIYNTKIYLCPAYKMELMQCAPIKNVLG